MKEEDLSFLARHDREVAQILGLEAKRQTNSIDLIASENHADRAILEAQSCLMNDNYAEGYPGRRYYSGCVHMDEIEDLAIQRAKELFKAEHANVQPHSGSQANMAAYLSLLELGDTVMGMKLSHGGHLTHGSRVNISGRYYQAYSYGVDRETNLINLDQVRAKANHSRGELLPSKY